MRINPYYSIESISPNAAGTWASVPRRSMESKLVTSVPFARCDARRALHRGRFDERVHCSARTAIRVRIEDEDKYMERTAREMNEEKESERGEESARETGKRRPACGTMHSRTFERLYASARPRGQV